MGPKISPNCPILALELGEGIHLFEVPALGQNPDLHDQFHRELQPSAAQGDKIQSVFPTDDSLLEMLYLAMVDITKKWTGLRKGWGIIHSQLEIFFADRLD